MINETEVRRAADYAKEKHAAQMRKFGGEPYIFHPMRVAEIVKSHEIASTETIIAAINHDVCEDTGTPLSEIEKQFGLIVRNLVMDLTKFKNTPKKTYYENLGQSSREVKVIKLADRLDNISDLEKADNDFRQYYIEDTRRLLKHIEDGDDQLADRIRSTLKKY